MVTTEIKKVSGSNDCITNHSKKILFRNSNYLFHGSLLHESVRSDLDIADLGLGYWCRWHQLGRLGDLRWLQAQVWWLARCQFMWWGCELCFSLSSTLICACSHGSFLKRFCKLKKLWKSHKASQRLETDTMSIQLSSVSQS